MEREAGQAEKDFRLALARIDNLYHVRQFKSLIQTKIVRWKLPRQQQVHSSDKNVHKQFAPKHHPQDYIIQLRRMLLHLIYLHYVAYVKKVNIWIYPHICIDKWGMLFRYYSVNEQPEKFMKCVEYEDFMKVVGDEFIAAWDQTGEFLDEEEMKKRAEEASEEESKPQHERNKKTSKNSWEEFGELIVEAFDREKKSSTQPKDFIAKLEKSRYMRNNVLMVGVLNSTLFPCVKTNKLLESMLRQSLAEQQSIIGKIFSESDLFQTEGLKAFIDCIFRFLKVLNQSKVQGITTTSSEKFSQGRQQLGQSLLTEFSIMLNQAKDNSEMIEQGNGQKMMSMSESEMSMEMVEEKDKNFNTTSNEASERDYNEFSELKDSCLLKCQYFWMKKTKPKELMFRVSISVAKKVYPLYFNQIERIWSRLSQKWKVILDENKQLSGFNPGFVTLDYNKVTHNVSFTEYVKYQPMQNMLSELILATDKLIITVLLMKEIICFYEKKSLAVQLVQQDLVMNEGRVTEMAKSVNQVVRNYYGLYKGVMNEVAKNL